MQCCSKSVLRVGSQKTSKCGTNLSDAWQSLYVPHSSGFHTPYPCWLMFEVRRSISVLIHCRGFTKFNHQSYRLCHSLLPHVVKHKKTNQQNNSCIKKINTNRENFSDKVGKSEQMYALKIASTVLAKRFLTFHISCKKVCSWEHIGRDRSFTCFFCVYILQKNENFLAYQT